MNFKTSAKLYFDSIEISTQHGYYADERKIRQKFEVDVELGIQLEPMNHYQLKDVVNYEVVIQKVTSYACQTEELIENVALKIVKEVLELDEKIMLCKVNIKKYPQLGQKHNGVSFELEAKRD